MTEFQRGFPGRDFPVKSWEFNTKVLGREETREGLGINPVRQGLRFQKPKPKSAHDSAFPCSAAV